MSDNAMIGHKTLSPADPPDDAFNRVLQAEQDMLGDVGNCRAEALAILRRARARARDISRLADRRISQMHSLSDAAVQTTLDQLNAESRGLSESPRMTRDLATQTDAAIEQLIREILE